MKTGKDVVEMSSRSKKKSVGGFELVIRSFLHTNSKVSFSTLNSLLFQCYVDINLHSMDSLTTSSTRRFLELELVGHRFPTELSSLYL